MYLLLFTAAQDIAKRQKRYALKGACFAVTACKPMIFPESLARWAEKKIRTRFLVQFGYPLPLQSPQTFREKLFARMVWMHRRHTHRYTLMSDKLQVRSYIKQRIGARHLSKIVWSGTDPNQAPLESYGNGEWIAKTNHGSGGHRLIAAGDQGPLRQHMKAQLEQNYYWIALEAQYFHIHPQLYIEQLVQGANQPQPLIYRLWCFGGRTELIQVDDSSLCNPFYSRSWERLELSYRGSMSAGYSCAAPRNLDKMLTLAELLAAPFGFVRVDLYNLGEQIIFSELTFTPLAGELWFEPICWDLRLGSLWTVEE
jgi:hypothetical protein